MSVICKRIYPKELPPKQNEKVWIDFMESVRREVLFYRGLMSDEGRDIRHLFPKIYDIRTNYNEKIEAIKDPMGMNSLIIMANVSDAYIQRPAMSLEEAKVVLKNIAEFHAYYWAKLPKDGERGSFWALERRLITGELEASEVKKTWEGFLSRFPLLCEEFSDSQMDEIKSLGPSLCSMASQLEEFIQRGAVTRIHGDLKGWNLFLSPEKALLIDMQWTGVGHPLQDIAYVLTTSLESDYLPHTNNLVDYYVNQLKAFLGNDVGVNYESLRAQYDLVWLDYVRVIVSGIWRKLSPESMKANEDKVGPSMINRSMEHVIFIIERLHHLIVEKSILSPICFKEF